MAPASAILAWPVAEGVVLRVDTPDGMVLLDCTVAEALVLADVVRDAAERGSVHYADFLRAREASVAPPPVRRRGLLRRLFGRA